MKHLLYILAVVILLVAGACSRHSESWATLDRADAVMEEHPDSALALLQGIDSSTLKDEEEKARYALLMSMALMKEGYAVTDTSFIAGALKYYQKDDDSPEYMKSLYLMADILHNVDEYGGAMSMLLKAYDIAEEREDHYWQAKTSELMGDVSSSAYNDEDLAEFSSRAAEYYGKAGKENNRRFVLVDHAIAMANMGNVEGALIKIDSINRLGSVFPSDSALVRYCARARISILVGNGWMEDALTAIDSVAKPDLGLIIPAKTYANLAKIFIKRNDWHTAACCITKADSLKRTTADSIAVLSAYADYYTGKNDLLKAGVYSDSLVWMQDGEFIKILKYSTVASQRDFIKEKEREANKRAYYTGVVFVVSVLFLITVITVLIYVYSLRLRAERAEKREKFKDLTFMTDRFINESEKCFKLLECVAQGKSLLRDREEEICSKSKDLEDMSAQMQSRLMQNSLLSEELRKLKAAISEKDGRIRATDYEIDRLLNEIRVLDGRAGEISGKTHENASKSLFKDEKLSALFDEVYTLSREVSELRAEKDSISAQLAIGEKELQSVNALLMEKTQGISMMRKEQSEREHALHREMYELYKGNWITLNLLCRQLSANPESELDNRLVVEEIEKELSELRSEKSIMKIEERINKYSDNLVSKLRAQCTFLKPDDIKFLIFIMAGFSSHGVCVILGLSQSNFYKKRKRLLERISSSGAPDRDAFVAAISGSI